MNILDLTKEEIAASYSHRHGFVFDAQTSSTDESIKRFTDILIDAGYAESEPESFVKLNGGKTWVIIYPENAYFAIRDFLRDASKISRGVNVVVGSIIEWVSQ